MKRNSKIVYIALIVISLGFLLYTYIFTSYGYNMMMMRHHYGYSEEFRTLDQYIFSVLIVVAYLTLILAIIRLLISRKSDSNLKALNILDERLSKGEISVDEYKEIKKYLK